MSRFTVPRDIYYGSGSLEELKNLKGKKAIVVVGGSSMKKTGFLDKTVDYLKSAGMKVKIFEGVEPDPSVETVMKGAEVMSKFQPDWIVSIGGGSPIDAAKAMWAFYEYPETSFEDLITPFSFPELRTKAKFAAIPSTSGTATEVTAFSVITDYDKGIKYPLADYNITPDIAIVDPDVAQTMPKQLTAHTGMDALTHSFEAYVSDLHSPFTDPLALSAIKLVFENIQNSYAGDMEAKENMHYAQCLAGMAFSNALLGIVHSLAHKTGAVFEGDHIPHGEANAIYLPYVIQFNEKKAGGRYADIARFIGLEGKDDHELTDRLIDKINDYNMAMEIPKSMKEWGIPEEEFKAKVKKIAVDAVGDACTGSNPRDITTDEMEKLLNKIYYGENVDF